MLSLNKHYYLLPSTSDGFGLFNSPTGCEYPKQNSGPFPTRPCGRPLQPILQPILRHEGWVPTQLLCLRLISLMALPRISDPMWLAHIQKCMLNTIKRTYIAHALYTYVFMHILPGPSYPTSLPPTGPVHPV